MYANKRINDHHNTFMYILIAIYGLLFVIISDISRHFYFVNICGTICEYFASFISDVKLNIISFGVWGYGYGVMK